MKEKKISNGYKKPSPKSVKSRNKFENKIWNKILTK